MSTQIQAPKKTTSTHCPYCAFQCGMNISGEPEQAIVVGNDDFPVNKGALCLKGWTSAEVLAHPERLRTPLIRTSDGQLRTASWEAAMDRIEEAVRDSQAKYGPESVGMFGGGSLTNEKAYLMGKFARVALRTPNIDYNGRFCMSSAAAASIRAFGIDRGLPFPVEDIAGAKTILLVGSNAAETMPPIMQYFGRQQETGGRLIVADPRLTPTAQKADLHLQLTPGTDAALANGPAPRPDRRGPDRRGLHKRTHGGFRACEGERGVVLAGQGGADHGCAGGPDCPRGADAGGAPIFDDDTDGQGRRTAGAGCQQHALIYKHRARAGDWWASGTAGMAA